jgi:isocitrate dehydrogenase kinase/phosphatase
MATKTHKHLIEESSQIIYDGFARYNIAFHRITRRARTRFEQQDWQGHQQDIVERVDLYEKSVRRIVLALRRNLGPRVNDHELWDEIRAYFGERLKKVPDAGFIKTFFNSVTRRIFGTIGVDPKLEFVSSSLDEDKEMIQSLSLRRYPYWGSLEKIFETILDDFSFRVPYANLEDNANKIAGQIGEYAKNNFKSNNRFLRFEFIDSFFYQSARAYLVGRIVMQIGISPLVIAFKNTDKGIVVDAVLMSDEEVSIVFSYTRSYYFADPNSVVGAVHFIHSILPKKPIDELYTVLGRLRQGKTERHLIFTEHLNNTKDKFVHADGDDKLVSKHDRAGRLIDTQEFLNLEFPIKRFSKELMNELLEEAGQTVKIVNDNLLINHVYIERRVRPLNLYINDVERNEAELAILDYGQALKDLAQTNIFPGDLLLKNFGVTRHKRVIFYDYDEVSLIISFNG